MKNVDPTIKLLLPETGTSRWYPGSARPGYEPFLDTNPKHHRSPPSQATILFLLLSFNVQDRDDSRPSQETWRARRGTWALGINESMNSSVTNKLWIPSPQSRFQRAAILTLYSVYNLLLVSLVSHNFVRVPVQFLQRTDTGSRTVMWGGLVIKLHPHCVSLSEMNLRRVEKWWIKSCAIPTNSPASQPTRHHTDSRHRWVSRRSSSALPPRQWPLCLKVEPATNRCQSVQKGFALGSRSSAKVGRSWCVVCRLVMSPPCRRIGVYPLRGNPSRPGKSSRGNKTKSQKMLNECGLD